MIDKLTNYLKGTKAELKQVNWPTRQQTTNFTLLVIGVSALVSAYLGFFDRLFTYLLSLIV